MAGKAVAKKEDAGLPAEYAGYEEYAGQGLDDITSEDKGLPFFDILQGQSPELELEGAKPGLIINKATKEMTDSIRFVPVCREHLYAEWVPRDNGGGLVASHAVDSDLVREARAKQRVGKFIMPSGNELIETFYLYGMVLDDNDTPTPAVISFSSTKIKAYKTLTTRSDSLMFTNAQGRKVKFPWFAHVWRLGSVKEKKDNYSWYNWTVRFDGDEDTAASARLPSDHEAVRLGSEIFAQHRQGLVKVNTDSMSNESGGGSGGGSGEHIDGEPPF